MHIDEANFTNLVDLWKKYGGQQIASIARLSLWANKHWPYRCWLESADITNNDMRRAALNSETINALLHNLPESSIIPVCSFMKASNEIEQQLVKLKWVCKFEQTAMYLKLDKAAEYQTFGAKGVELKRADSVTDIESWVDICSEAFGYRIDRMVIDRITNDQDIQLFLGCQSGQAVATALLYKTGDVIGLHQMGVKQDFQGKGIARDFMQKILMICTLWHAKTIVLQASKVGSPLYNSLGFQTQFFIKSFQR